MRFSKKLLPLSMFAMTLLTTVDLSANYGRDSDNFMRQGDSPFVNIVELKAKLTNLERKLAILKNDKRPFEIEEEKLKREVNLLRRQIEGAQNNDNERRGDYPNKTFSRHGLDQYDHRDRTPQRDIYNDDYSRRALDQYDRRDRTSQRETYNDDYSRRALDQYGRRDRTSQREAYNDDYSRRALDQYDRRR